MKKLVSLFAILATVVSGVTAQTLTVAGGNTATDRYIPVYGYYMDVPQKSHVLYPANLLTDMVGSHITGLTYYFSSLPSGAWGGTQMVRMGITTSSNLQNGYDNASVTTVWTGTLSSCISGSTMVITLDEPFPYTGGNLLIEFENPTAATWKDSYFYGANQTAQLSYMTYTTSVSTYTHGAAFLPQTTFAYESGCFAPIHTYANNISVDTVLLTWNTNPILPASSYTVAYMKVPDTVFTEVAVTDTFLTLTGLQISTDYEWKVRSHCDTAGMSDWSTVNTFTTLQHPAILPYQCGFEDNAENLEWGFAQNAANQWHIGEAVARNGEASLYISNDGGENNAYTNTQSSVAWAYRDIQLPAGQAQYQISFDFKGMGQNGQDYVKVFLGTQTTPSSSAAPAGATQLGDALRMVYAWQHFSFTVDASFAGNQRLYFLWVNNGADGTNPPAAIDNIRVEASDCAVPAELTLLSVTDSSATVSWNAVPGATAGYEVAYHLDSDSNYLTVTTMDTFCVLPALQSASDYLWMVRARCSATSQSAWCSESYFHTPIAIAQVPYFCGFEDAVENNNWQYVNGTNSDRWCIGTAAFTEGETGLYISNDNGEHNKYTMLNSFTAWAYRDIYIDSTATDVLLSFDYRNALVPANSAKVFMGPPTTPSGNSVPQNAVQLGNSLSTSINEWKRANFLLDSTQRGLQRLYFLFYYSANSYYSDNQPLAIDNLSVEASHCIYPFERSVASVDSTTALLIWSLPQIGQPSSYTVAYKQQDETDFTTVTVTDTFVLLTGLEYSTPYVWKIRSNCSPTEIGEWSPEKNFLSAQIIVPLPYCCDFEDSLENSQWQFITQDTNTQWYIGQAVNNGGTSALYVSGADGTTTSCSHPDYAGVNALVYRDIYFPEATEYLISFDVKESRCENTGLRFIVGQPTLNESIDYNSGIPTGSSFTYNFRNHYYDVPDTTWQHHDLIMNSSYVGVQRLYFSWYHNGIYPCSPTAAVDNFCVSSNNCGRPSALNQLTVTDTLAELSWHPFNNQTAESYTVAYREETDTLFTEVVVTDTTCIIGGLQPLTGYVWKVRANCSGSESSFWSNEEYFYTEQLHVELPYFCDFEDAVENSNWQFYQNYGAGYNQAWIGDAVACGEGHSLYITNDNGVTNSYLSRMYAPEAFRYIYFTPSYPKYQISFDCKGGGSMQGFLQVLLDGTPISGYLSDADFWTRHSIVVDSSYAGLHLLTLKFDYNTTWNPAGAFDNISIKGVSHETPVGLSTTDITAHTAHLSWTSDSSETSLSYRLAWRAQSDTTYTEILLSASDSAYLLSNLEASSWYVWKVKALYAGGEWSEWSGEKAFQTLARLPYFCDFEDNTESKNWTIRNGDYYFTTGGSSGYYSASQNKWFIGTPSDVADNQLLFISTDDGITNSYSLNRQSFVWAFRDIYLEPGYSQYQLSLDFKGVGEAGQDYVRIYLDTPEEPSHDRNAAVTLTQIGEDLNLTDQWMHKCFTVDSTHAGAQRLYILWNNNYNSGANPPAAIDNISIKVATCGVPDNMVSYPQDTSATLSWSSGSAGVASSYVLAYKMLYDSVYTVLTTQDTSLTIQGLIPNTDYIWHVKSLCSASDTSEWSSDALFTTTQTLPHLPYLCSFDNSTENSHWAIVNGSSENQWVIGNAIGYDDNHALYISNDGGTTNAYTITSTSSVWAYRDVFFDNGYTEYQLSFDFKGVGQGNNDYMKVFVGSPAVPSGTTTPAGAMQLGTAISSVNDWTHYAFTLDSTYSGVQRIYFLWVNNNSIGVQPPAAVDNLTVVGSDCAIPSELVLTGMTNHTVALAWTPASDNPVSYTVSMRQAGSTATSEYTTTDTFLTVSGLTPSAAYFCKVRANCSANDHSGWSSDLSVQMPAALPYICDFEDANERNAWQFVNGTYNNQWYIGNAVSLSGDYSLYISNNGGVTYAYSYPYNSSYVWAYRDIYFDPSDSVYTLSFDMRGVGGTSYQISAYTNVYIGSPATPNGTATPAGATELENGLCGMSAWTTKTYTIDYSHAGLQRLYFFWRNAGYTVANPPAAIDNIAIDGTPCNHVPSNLTAQAMDTLANLSWTLPGGSSVYYTIAYKSQTDTNFSYITTQDEHITLGNLTPTTIYIWKVRAHCTTTDFSNWSSESTFQTTVTVAHIPYQGGFEDPSENANWMIVNSTYTNQWFIGNAVNNGGNNALYVSNNNGVSNTYTMNTESYVWAYRDFYFTPNYQDYLISFDIRSFGELYSNIPYDYVKVFLGPPAIPAYNNIPSGATQLGSEYLNDSIWHTETFTVNSSNAGYQRLYFLWRNDGSYGTNPPGAIDNISITPVGCGTPRCLTVSQMWEDSAELSWPAIYQADSYTAAYRRASDSTYSYVMTTDNHILLTNLLPMTNYLVKVRTDCDTSQGAWSDEFQFSTTALPYFCGFEEAGENACWTLDGGMNNHKWYIGHAVHCDGDSALYVSNNNGVSNTFSDNVNAQIWAYRDIYFNPQYSEYLMEFDIRSYGYPGASVDYVRVFLGPPATPSGSYTPANAEVIGDFYGMTNWNHFRFVINGSHAGMQRLYFLWRQQVAGTNNPLAGAVDNISIVGSPCSIPTELTVSDLADVTAVVSWSPGACGITNGYTVGYRMSSDTGWYELSTTDTFLLLQNLQSSTQYTWRVRKSCVPSFASQWSDVSTFFTEATEAQLPYFCGFEESDENRDWRLLGVSTNRWYIGQAAQQAGQYALYVSNDNGATNAYDVYGSMTNSWAYRDIYFTPGYSEYQIAFDFRGLGQSGDDRTRIFLGPPTQVEPNGTYSITIPSELEELGNGLNTDAVWTSHSFTVDSTHAGHQRLYFLWCNGFYEGTNPPGAVDNIMVYGGTCAAPHDLTVTATSTTSISISFTPADTSDQNWEAVIVEDGQPIDTTQVVALTGAAYNFNNLHKDRLYVIYVRTNCGDSQSAWCSTSQRTDCGTITDIPYLESFDTYGTGSNLDGYSAFPRCWSRLCSSYIVAPYPFIFPNGYYSSPGSLYFQPSNGHNVAITPEFDSSIPMNTLQASFKFKANTTAPNSILVVGVMTDPNDFATFTPVDTVFSNPYALTSWIDRTVSLASYTGNGHYLAFMQENFSNPLTPVSMDNLTVDYLSACPLPTNVTAEPITHDSVLVDWQPGGSETAWRVVVVPNGNAPENGTLVQTGTHPIVIGDLADNTMYDVFVQSDCGSSSSSWCTPATFMTTCAPVVDLPYSENFDDYTWMSSYIVRPDCWIFPVTYADYPRIDWNTYGYYGMESKALLFHSDTSTTATAVTQPFGVDIHSLRAQFRLSADHEYIAGCMEVGVMSDPYDLSTFESVQVFSIAHYDTWQDVTVDFRNTAMTGTNRHIAFRQVGLHSSNRAMWLDDLIVYQADDCDAPSALTAHDLTSTSATISFEPSHSSASQWEYVACAPGVSPNTQTPVATANTSFVVDNLTPGQTYRIFVRTVCGSNSHSGWSEPLEITPDCGIISQLPYTETFDTYGTDSETAFPDCWRRILTPASYSYYPIVSSEVSASGVGSMLFLANSFSDDWAITPAFAPNLSFDSIQLDFSCFQEAGAVPGWDTMFIGVMSSPYDAASFVPVDTITLQSWGVWEPHSVLLDHYYGDGRYVAFRYHCPAYLGKVFIDDVVFSVRPDVGIPEHNLNQLLHLYPNPTNGKCTIRSEEYAIENVEVYDVFGKRLEQHFARDYQMVIDLSTRAAGVYFVRVTTEQGTVTKRVVKR